MKHASYIIGFILLMKSLSPARAADGAPQQLSDRTSKNIAVISASLSENQKAVSAMVASRADAIAAVSLMAAQQHVRADREMAILSNTTGAPLVKALDDLRKQADAAAQVPQQLAIADATLRAEVMAAAAPSSIAVDKLDAAAKKLALLAKPRSDRERLEEYARFVSDVKVAAEKLEAEGATKAEKASIKTAAAVIAANNATIHHKP